MTYEPAPLLINSNAPWTGSGYGMQTAELAPRVAATGRPVAISCMTGLSSQPTDWHGIRCLPCGMAAYNNDIIGHHAREFFRGKPGIVLTLYDAWTIDPDALAGLAAAMWTPVHCSPMTMGDRQFFATSGAYPIAMSQFGAEQMRGCGLEPGYAPHGINTDLFRPLEPAERREARRVLGVPDDCFLVSVVAANKGKAPPRKAWGELFAAFALFRAKHPKAVLFVHSLINGGGFGINLAPLVMNLGLADSVHFSDQYGQVAGYLTPAYVAGLLGASDVYLNPSMGEGFGLPGVEAQACGVPVILGDNSAQTEHCGAGWLVACQPSWQDDDQAWWATPIIADIVAKLEAAYDGARSPKLRRRAREWALQYDADLVFAEHWTPLLDMLDQYAGAAPVRVPRAGDVPLPTGQADGLTWIQRGSHTDDWIATGHEDYLAPYLDDLLPPDGVFLDVGAHVGRWSLRLARKASRVLAVEANPATRAVLAAHLALNKIANVDVLPFAAWDTAEPVMLSEPKPTSGSTRVLAAGDGDDGTVPGRPLDAVLGDEPRIDLVKLDVEGADLRALDGMAGTLARTWPNLLIERHDIYGYYRYADLQAWLAAHRYGWREVNIPLNDGAIAAYLACRPLAGDEEPPPVTVSAGQVASCAMNLGASQNETELRAAIALAQETGPSVIVEIGCDRGGTLYAWRQICDTVIGVTLADNSYQTGGTDRPLEAHGAHVVTGDSHDPATLAQVAGLLGPGGRIDVLMIDGDHTASGVRLDLEMYGPLVRPGGVILVHDISIVGSERGHDRAEVAAVWPVIAGRYKTTELRAPGGGLGYGVIHVRDDDTFTGLAGDRRNRPRPKPGGAQQRQGSPARDVRRGRK